MNYFKASKEPFKNTQYLVLGQDCFYNMVGPIQGSYNVMMARCFGLTYANFLRMVRDNYKARINGKNQKYPSLSFTSYEDALAFEKVINKQMTDVVNFNK